MKDTVYKGFVEFWSLENTKNKAEKNSKNKRSERGGKGIMRHTLGSMPMKQLEVELYKKNGVRPDIVTLLEESRRSKKTGQIIDKKAEEYVIAVKEKIQEIVIQRFAKFPEDDVCSTQLANEEILEVYEGVVPPDKEGNRYGLGSLRLKASSSRSVPPSGYVPIEQLQATQQTLQKNQADLARMDSEFTLMKEFLKRKFPNEDISMTD